ncbi:hypothetical protein OC845_002719 [Tilletia horrida]|nr:hypothetical protein OC845_002719 [Tilletia horrida]
MSRRIGDSWALQAWAYTSALTTAGFGISAFIDPKLNLKMFGWPYPIPHAEQVQMNHFFQIYGARNIFAAVAIAAPLVLGDRRSAGAMLICFGLVAVADGWACVEEGLQWNHWGYGPVLVLKGALMLGLLDGKLPTQTQHRQRRQVGKRGEHRLSQSILLTVLANLSAAIGVFYGLTGVFGMPGPILNVFGWQYPRHPLSARVYDKLLFVYGARDLLLGAAIWLPTLLGGHRTMAVLLGAIGLLALVDGYACFDYGAQMNHWSYAPILLVLSATLLGAFDRKVEDKSE